MYTVIKRMEISASHSLKLSYRSKCENLHGHNWIITVYCRSEVLNEDGYGGGFHAYQGNGDGAFGSPEFE